MSNKISAFNINFGFGFFEKYNFKFHLIDILENISISDYNNQQLKTYKTTEQLVR